MKKVDKLIWHIKHERQKGESGKGLGLEKCWVGNGDGIPGQDLTL